jgi:predicted dienelactone hydrolase
VAAVLTTLAGAVVVAGCVSGGTPSGSVNDPSASSATSQASTAPPAPVWVPVGTLGKYGVASSSRLFTDTSRRRLGPRPLHTVIYRPVIPAVSGTLARDQFPLIVFAPGYLQCTSPYRVLLRQWASAGYVVAAVQFPRTNCHIAHPDEDDMVHQPGDLTYVIDQLLAMSRASHGLFSGLLNPREIAVAGHSDGGDTVAAMVANTCCIDHRVAAAVVLAGAKWPQMPGRYFVRPTPPMLFVQGNADTCNPPAASVQLYQADTTGRRYYLNLPGANHFTPYVGRGTPEPVVARVTTDFLDRYLVDRHGAGAAMRQDGNAAGVAELTSGSAPPPNAAGSAGLSGGCNGGPGTR